MLFPLGSQMIHLNSHKIIFLTFVFGILNFLKSEILVLTQQVQNKGKKNKQIKCKMY